MEWQELERHLVNLREEAIGAHSRKQIACAGADIHVAPTRII